MDAIMGRQRIITSLRAASDTVAGRPRRFVLPIAPSVGVVTGLFAAVAFLVMPIAILEDMAVDSGIASLLTAAQPPLGLTARLAVATFAGIGVGAISWFATFLLFGARTLHSPTRADDGVPVLRRADAHPDAPARRPVFAHRDLGTPFLEVKAAPAIPVERALPADLDTPMAHYLSPLEATLPEPDPLPIVREAEPIAPAPMSSFDPAAFAAFEEPAERAPESESFAAPEPAPAATSEPTAEPRFAAHERIETFVMPAADGVDPAAPLPQATIHDLLERLERGVARQQPEPAPAVTAPPASSDEPSLEETLATLRALARRVG